MKNAAIFSFDARESSHFQPHAAEGRGDFSPKGGNMEASTSTHTARNQRIRNALLVICALVLFLAGLLLLFAPGPGRNPGQDEQSQLTQRHFPSAGNGRIMGSQTRKSISLAGG
jgi:hypothetical protein